MKKNTSLLSLALIPLFIASSALANTWTAKCEGIFVRIDTETHHAELFLTAGELQVPVAQGGLVYQGEVAVRARFADGLFGKGTDVGLNKDRGIVYVMLRDTAKESVFCRTPIQVQP